MMLYSCPMFPMARKIALSNFWPNVRLGDAIGTNQLIDSSEPDRDGTLCIPSHEPSWCMYKALHIFEGVHHDRRCARSICTFRVSGASRPIGHPPPSG